MFGLILSLDETRAAIGEQLGVGVTGLKTMGILLRNGPTASGALAVGAGITSGSMTSTIDKLVKSKFAVRQKCLTDGRSRVIDLTDDGRKAMEWMVNFYYESISAALPDPSAVDTISAYLESIAEKFYHLAGQAGELPREP